jgi:hypothetical protein
MKYYIYISDTKVDMLFAQIPRNILKKISAELNINLGMVSVSLKEKQSEQTRFHKAKVVSNYINKHLDVGDIDHPKTYFKGTLPMRWGPYGDEKFVYFGGTTKSGTILGLGGSMHHVIGQERGELSGGAEHSVTFAIVSKICGELGIPLDYKRLETMGEPRDRREMRKPDDELVLDAVGLSTPQLRGPTQNLELLAKKLVEGEGLVNVWNLVKSEPESKHILLGTPIYVAYAD